MSSPGNLVPMFDPQGVLRDVPQESMMDAVRSGGTPAVRFQAPDGQIRMVPATRLQDAVKAGGKMLPIEQQDIQHPGFWSSLGSDLVGMAKGVSSMLGPATPGIGAIPWAANLAIDDMQRQQEGRSTPYRVAAPIAQNLTGANVRGMEESANEGDVAGVMGHAAAVPTVMAASEALAHGGPIVADQAAPLVRAGVRGINKGLEKAPGTIGGTAGAAIGGYFGGHIGAEVGGVAGAVAGRELLPQVRIPGEGFGLPNRVTGGPASAPPYAALAENPSAQSISSAPNPSATAAAAIPRTLSGEGALSQVLSQLSNADLLRIAKARGINVSREVVLKPGRANGLLINKIVGDFSPDELAEVRDTYLEQSRFQHQFSNQMTPEAWSTIATQTYFPEVKIPQTVLTRTQQAMANMTPRTKKGLGLQ